MSSLLLVALLACGPGDAPADTPDDKVEDTDVVDTDTDIGPSGDSGLAADTWANFGEAFFADYCVRCHDGGGKDFRSYADVVAKADLIKCGTATAASRPADCGSWPPAEQFPVSAPNPSDEDRDRLVAWILAGLPE